MSILGTCQSDNLLSADRIPDWKVKRFPFVDAAPEVIAKMLPGYLVKFNAGGDAVLPALAADDAALGGIIIDLPAPDDVNHTVAVALSGSFNQRQIHYANAWNESPPTALSDAAVQRLRDIDIYLDPSVPTGPSNS